MFTDKKNVLQLAVLLAAHGIRRIVLCPGSRDIPLVRTFAAMPEKFTCYAVTDERSAGFFALGLSLHDGRPVAVCCTSGSALLNLHPAVAEAFYRQVPLVVISADRPAAWIGQMDGQTLPQPGVFGPLVKKSVSLPEVKTEEDEWYCNRLINEALLETEHHGRGPVHINVPISEPFFDCPVETLPPARVIARKDKHFEELAERLKQLPRRMLLIGQGNPGDPLPLNLEDTFACFASHPANYTGAAIRNAEPLISALSPETGQLYRRGHPQCRAFDFRPEPGDEASVAPRPRRHLRRTRPLQTVEAIPAELSPYGALAHCPLGRGGRPLRCLDRIGRSGAG